MSSAKQNRSIARLIVGAMSIDGSLDKSEREKVAHTLVNIGMGELVADVGAAIEEDTHNFNMFQECKELLDSLGSDATEVGPMVFRIVTDVVASDRFVSSNEAAYLSAMSRRLGLQPANAKKIFKQVMADRRGRLEVSGKQIDGALHPHLKELLSFEGADSLVGEVAIGSLEDILRQAQETLAEGAGISIDEAERALTILGLDTNATLDQAKQVWLDTIDNLHLPKMASLGETFVSAAIGRISRINDAYKTVLKFHSLAAEAKTKV